MENEQLGGYLDCVASSNLIALDKFRSGWERPCTYELQGTTSKLEDGKPLKGRQGILTKSVIEKMKRSCGKAIYNHLNRGTYSVEERDATAHAMQTEIMAGLYYSTRQRKTQVLLEQYLEKAQEENSLAEYTSSLRYSV